MLGPRLFSFAVIADTHVNQEEDRASSDFAVNRLSNARNRYAMHAVKRAEPAFVLHLGDIVHPNPGHPGYGAAAARFHELASVLECPLYLAPGNHDVGDKPGDWLPVPSVNDAYLELYREHFGPGYQSFDAHGCHFVLMDAQLLNSGLAPEARQKEWLEADLAANRGKRTFFGLHYPPFVLDPAEEGHYDNIDEPGRSWLLALLARHGVEALFAGHVHNFWYHELAGTRFYLLPSTSFVRLDYSEMFRIEPAPERGRNDAAKLGFFLVDVHERGHVTHTVRTHGAVLAPGEEPPGVETLPPVNPRTIARSPIGIDLRHEWAEVTHIAASGALEEFGRKRVRNDYAVMALWEMGVRALRVPLEDLLDARVRERMRALTGTGHEFTVYSHGLPPCFESVVAEHAELVSAWEVITPVAQVARLAERICAARPPFPLRLSRLRRPDEALHRVEKNRHVIEHGFDVSDAAAVESLLAAGTPLRAAFAGAVFRVPCDRVPWTEIEAIARIGARSKLRNDAMVRLAADNPAVAMDDQLAGANRVAATFMSAHAFPGVGVWLDTFADVDRGYFPRTGLVDRRYNPRLAGRVLRSLNSALAGTPGSAAVLAASQFEGGTAIAAEAADWRGMLILPTREKTWTGLPEECVSRAGAPGQGDWIDLGRATRERMRWGPTGLLDQAVVTGGPILILLPA